MQILLASAKIMRQETGRMPLVPSVPRFLDQAMALSSDMAAKGASELSELFGCSMDIANLNIRRYSIFGTDEAEILPAILAYYGQAYKHLRAHEMTDDDIVWADSHIWITSFMYGMLRPLDGICQYRMEGGFPLPSTQGMKVSEFWKGLLTDLLIESVLSDDGVLVYLDTEEYRQMFNWKRVVSQVPTIIEPQFHVLKNGKLTTPSVWAKTCRGAMTRFVIDNRITDPALLKGFDNEGFRHDPEAGDGYVFVKR